MKKRFEKSEPTAIDRTIEKMPPLRHSQPGEPFNVRRSEVARWLCSQPEIMQWVFNVASHRGFMVYDQQTGTWRGARYEG